MFKNISYLLFGGIKWRLKGFFIGVAVGMALGSFIPDKLAEWLPSAYADATEWNLDGVDNLSTANNGTQDNIPGSTGVDTILWHLKVPDSLSEDKIQLQNIAYRMTREPDSPPSGTPSYSWYVYAPVNTEDSLFTTNVGSTPAGMNATLPENYVGPLLGGTPDQLRSDLPLTTDYPDIADWNGGSDFPPITTADLLEVNPGDLVFSPGDNFVLVLAVHWAYSSTSQIRAFESYNALNPSPYGVVRSSCSNETINSSCSNFLGATQFSPMITINYEEYVEPQYWSIGYGPYISSSEITYNLPYYCYQAGAIWGYDPDVDGDYIDLGIDCTADEAGFLNLDLSSDVTPWLLIFEPAASPGTFWNDYSIVIYHDEYGPTIPEGYEEADSGGLCFTILQYAGEDPPPDLDQATVVSMFFTAMGKFVNIPIIGDYVMVNCWVKSGLIDSMVYDNIGTLDVDIAMMGDVDSFVLDLDGVRDQLKGSFDDNAGYDAFRQLMTVLFWASVVFLLWKKFGSDHHDNSNPS